jgi:cell division protein ZapA (FtsZ GTPase activity inhibitor)
VVTVFGRDISVKSSASAEKVKAVETFVNTRLQEIGAALKSGDAQLVLTLALLNTAEELLDRRRNDAENGVLENKIQGMLDKLESV